MSIIASESLCTFRIEDLWLAVEVQAVQEVLRLPQLTPVPRAPAHIRGLMNLRGQIVPALDLRHRLELPTDDVKSCPVSVVVNTQQGRVGLMVDEIGDVIPLEESRREATPPTLSPSIRSVVLDCLRMDQRLLLMIDLRAAVELAA